MKVFGFLISISLIILLMVPHDVNKNEGSAIDFGSVQLIEQNFDLLRNNRPGHLPEPGSPPLFSDVLPKGPYPLPKPGSPPPEPPNLIKM